MIRVLVVEDEANIRKFVAINLSARGYDVIEASDAREGLARLRDASPAILLLDIKLPDMSGWELLKIMAADPALTKIPVVVITASMGNAAPDYGTYQNLHKILIKPVSAQELTHVVKEALN
jgi:DNA-binding response OmpR family regulator